MQQQKVLTNGPAAATVLAAAIGSLTLGLLTTLAEAIGFIKKALIFYSPVGPLSGKTTMAVVVWLVAWVLFTIAWKNKEVRFSSVFAVSLILITLGLIGTFPPFFELFGK